MNRYHNSTLNSKVNLFTLAEARALQAAARQNDVRVVGGAAFTSINKDEGDRRTRLTAPVDGLSHHSTEKVSWHPLLRPQWIAVTREGQGLDNDLEENPEVEEENETVLPAPPLSVQKHLLENQP